MTENVRCDALWCNEAHPVKHEAEGQPGFTYGLQWWIENAVLAIPENILRQAEPLAAVLAAGPDELALRRKVVT